MWSCYTFVLNKWNVTRKSLPPRHLYILQAGIPANQGAPLAAAMSLPLSIATDKGNLTGGPLWHDGKNPGGQNHNLEIEKRMQIDHITINTADGSNGTTHFPH